MNTAPLKTFAINSRNILKRGVIERLNALGFDAQGNLVAQAPEFLKGGIININGEVKSVAGGVNFLGKVIDDKDFFEGWMQLRYKISLHGIKHVCEEAAYTWFNRLVAIRIMQKNHFIEPVMEYVDCQSRIPLIVSKARSGMLTLPLNEDEREKLNDLLKDPTKTEEQFRFLIKVFCEKNAVIYNCFGGIEKYIALLLPDHILARGGFIDLLNSTSYISDEDYTRSELIGWLYQFYISEKKDEVFAGFKKGAKAQSDDIPAATQIFTPNWIVKYMVQNTIGRIYLDNNPSSSIRSKMTYLVDGEDTASEGSYLKVDEITEYTLLDPACGSGHILNEGFDLLYDMYMEEFYSPRMAIENIFRKNLLGIDIDTRAAQLSSFALLMKAAHKESSFLDARVMPRILTMPEPIVRQCSDIQIKTLIREFFRNADLVVLKETFDALSLLGQADNLGSIMRFNFSDSTLCAIKANTAFWDSAQIVPSEVRPLLPSMHLIIALTDKYTAVVANPPYMGSGNMNPELSKYVEANYKEGKTDLATVFVLRMMQMVYVNGYYSFIIPPSWMFLGSFEELRKKIIENNCIQSLLHLSRGVFGADFGASSAVIKNSKGEKTGTYFRLVERTFQEFDQKHLRTLFEKTLANHDFKYKFSDYSKEVSDITYSEDGNRIYYPHVLQSNFTKIPGSPIGYWVSEKMIEHFSKDKKLKDVANLRSGISTGDNERFYRFWFECNTIMISPKYDLTPFNSEYKWFKIIRGGNFRRWYGCCDNVINLKNSCNEIANSRLNHRLRTPKYYNEFGITWNRIASGQLGFRIKERETNFGENSPCLFTQDYFYLLGLLNSKCIAPFLKAVNPTLSNQVADLIKLPIVKKFNSLSVNFDDLVQSNISISKQDWDAHETSWDFRENELVRLWKKRRGEGELALKGTAQSIESLVDEYKQFWEGQFMQLHSNEEELNRQFIDIYGLQDELKPDVPLDEITILQQGEISIENNSIIWHDDVLIKQLISYAIGCYMGRYRLDKPGLNIAYYPKDEEISSYKVGGEDFRMDDDGIIPLMSSQNPFEDDNARQKIVNFIITLFGAETLTQNLNYMDQCLGRNIEDYLVKDFWKDHKKMYQNRPIYWLFASKKGAFQVIVYMHRMNPYTAEKVRTKYLLPYMEYLQGRISKEKEHEADLSSQERKELKRMEGALEECREYHDRLHDVAERRISFDLDDGVVVNHALFGDILAKLK